MTGRASINALVWNYLVRLFDLLDC